MANGSLLVVGSGIRGILQMTREAERAIRDARKVFYLVSDELTERYIRRLNPVSDSLLSMYREGEDRSRTYGLMVELIVSEVKSGNDVCAVFYGHPGIFVYPSHAAVHAVKQAGFPARMLPGISAADCLMADLGVFCPITGYQSFLATDLVLRPRTIDPSLPLILWQIDSIADNTYSRGGNAGNNLPLLGRVLSRYYPPEHKAYLYEAAVLPTGSFSSVSLVLADLAAESFCLNGMGTLIIPPVAMNPVQTAENPEMPGCIRK